MRTIGMLLGVPEEDQQALRDHIDEGLRLDDGGSCPTRTLQDEGLNSDYGEYIDWRIEHPSDDLMTELLTAEFTDEQGTVRTLTRDEVLGYIALLAGAGNETTTRLIGWAARAARRAPRSAQGARGRPGAHPQRHGGVPPLRAALAVQARYVTRDVEQPRSDRPGGQRHGASSTGRPTATSASSPTPTASTSTGRSSAT